ncbi:24346_t:CDS:1 [Cetraspora pellucida]|uniref:24346_t:CDS:1 n=1 Tax=Cetraspora pellucida TaxID=1433469 RepID=A0A9N8W775_9GLOM|nr:24346_t:CDS:1 [Cetraspora pellucida]
MKDITGKQIYYWWSFFTQLLYQQHEDPVKSAIILIENKFQSKNCKLLFAKISDTLVAIAFSTPLFDELKNTKEVHLDATYKTAKGYFEFYGLIAEKNRTGFTLGYLVLDIKQDEIELTRISILVEFLF